MRANRRRDTGPERLVRSLLHSSGLRYRVDLPVSVGGHLVRPDIAFTSRRVAVFIDGCFWHGCPQHGRRPSINKDYWGPKLARNRERDREQSALLRSEGWTVLRIWEHVPPDQAVAEILGALN
jgi:DNA mismatch endonuclease, patch repair protein